MHVVTTTILIITSWKILLRHRSYELAHEYPYAIENNFSYTFFVHIFQQEYSFCYKQNEVWNEEEGE